MHCIVWDGDWEEGHQITLMFKAFQMSRCIIGVICYVLYISISDYVP